MQNEGGLCHYLCMIGTIRTKQTCRGCGGSFTGEPLSCPKCGTVPNRYYIDLYWKKRHKLYSDQDSFVISSWEQANRFLTHIRYSIDRDSKSKGKFRFNPKDYVRRDIEILKFENYAKNWLICRLEEIQLSDGISRGYLKSVESYVRNHMIPFFKNLNIREIEENHIDDFRRQLPRELSSKTVYNILGILSKIFKEAYRRREIERVPIFPRVKFTRPPIKWIEEKEQESILNEVKEPIFKALFVFLMKQGCRPNEGRALTWDKIDFKEDRVIINAAIDENIYRERTKTRDIRILPMHPRVKETLEKLPNRGITGFVFTYRGEFLKENTVNNVWRRAANKAEIDISLYQATKHSGASQALNAGVDIGIIQAMLGHKDPRTTARYMELKTDRLKAYWSRTQTVPNAKKQKAKLIELKGK